MSREGVTKKSTCVKVELVWELVIHISGEKSILDKSPVDGVG